MIATKKLVLADLSRQKRVTARLDEDLTPENTVEHALELYRERLGLPDNGRPWSAFSRGLRLDRNTRLADLPEEDDRWTVMPEVSAG